MKAITVHINNGLDTRARRVKNYRSDIDYDYTHLHGAEIGSAFYWITRTNGTHLIDVDDKDHYFNVRNCWGDDCRVYRLEKLDAYTMTIQKIA